MKRQDEEKALEQRAKKASRDISSTMQMPHEVLRMILYFVAGENASLEWTVLSQVHETWRLQHFVTSIDSKHFASLKKAPNFRDLNFALLKKVDDFRHLKKLHLTPNKMPRVFRVPKTLKHLDIVSSRETRHKKSLLHDNGLMTYLSLVNVNVKLCLPICKS